MADSDSDNVNSSVPSREKGKSLKQTQLGATDTTIAKDEHDPRYLTGMALFSAAFSVSLTIFLVLLDTSIVSTAIPRITDEFRSLGDVGWYGSAYQLANASLQPLTGKVYTYFSTKWSFLGFFFLFELGSLLCGVATSSTMLIVARAVAGMGSSGLMNGGLTIITGIVPADRRAMLTGLCMGVGQVGTAVGPLIGGALTQYTTWRWCFYLNLPVGAVVAVFLVLVRIPDQVAKPSPWTVLPKLHRYLDLVGFALFAPSVIMLLLAIEYGGSGSSDGSGDAWGSATVIGLFCGAGATFCVWLAWDWRMGDDALLPLGLLAKRLVWTASLAQGCLMTALLLISYFLPIYFQAVKGVSPLTSGVYLLPSILPQVVTTVASGAVVGRTGYPTLYALFASATAAVSGGLLSTMQPDTTTAQWVGYQVLAGGGRGVGMQMPFVMMQTLLPPQFLALAMAFMIFSQFILTAVFLTVGNTIFNQALVDQLAVHAPAVDAQAVLAAGATGFRTFVDEALLPGVLQAYSNSITKIFYIVAAAGVVAVGASYGMGVVDTRRKKTGTDEEASSGETE